jgi:hypothetical protein
VTTEPPRPVEEIGWTSQAGSPGCCFICPSAVPGGAVVVSLFPVNCFHVRSLLSSKDKAEEMIRIT